MKKVQVRVSPADTDRVRRWLINPTHPLTTERRYMPGSDFPIGLVLRPQPDGAIVVEVTQ